MTNEHIRRMTAPRPRRTLDLSRLDGLLNSLRDDEWEPDFVHSVTAPLLDLWSVVQGPFLLGRGEDKTIAVLDVTMISIDRCWAMTNEGVVALGRRAPLPLLPEGRP